MDHLVKNWAHTILFVQADQECPLYIPTVVLYIRTSQQQCCIARLVRGIDSAKPHMRVM